MIPAAWSDLPFFGAPYAAIRAAIATDQRKIFPPETLRFAALEACKPEDVRVVILGQDPYHTPGKADGLAFSIPDSFGGRLDSLGNIFKEIESDTGQSRSKTSLDDWAYQGVLLLNTALTVPRGAPKAHARIGWSTLVQQILERLSAHPRAFVLWGGPAQSYSKFISGEHFILSSAHPSPLSCYRGFFGTRPFSKVNQWLIEQGHEPIHWADP